MMKGVVSVVGLLVLAQCALAHQHSMRLHRQPDRMLNEVESMRFRANNKAIGNHPDTASYTKGNTVVPLGGGLLLIGTYYVNFTVGASDQHFSALIDTGSSNLALPTPGCKSCGSGVPVYDPSKSSSANVLKCSDAKCAKCNPNGSTTDCVFDKPADMCARNGVDTCYQGVTYGGGSSTLGGSLVEDKVCINGLCVTNSLIAITEEQPSASFQNSPYSGILGLASEFNTCNPTCITPLYQQIAAEHNLPNGFGMCLTKASGGALDMGSPDANKYHGELQYAPMTMDRWYNFGMDSITIGDAKVPISKILFRTTNDVIGTFVDSGTSVILMGPQIFANFQSTFVAQYGHINGVKGLFNGQCVSGLSPSALPNITFHAYGEKGNILSLPVPASAYLLPQGNCVALGIAATPSLGVILGDVFLENYYVHYDRANQRVGFAPVAKC